MTMPGERAAIREALNVSYGTGESVFPDKTPPSPMAVQITRLNQVLSSLGGSLGDLASLIEPVLSPNQTFQPNENLADPRELRAPIVESISDAGDCGERLIEQVLRMIDRVQV